MLLNGLGEILRGLRRDLKRIGIKSITGHQLLLEGEVISRINKVIDGNTDIGNLSDGYHTFNELYEYRKLYNAALFNEWYLQNKNNVQKCLKHSDGELCFGGGWFIVVADLNGKQISNHYELKDWDLFKVPEVELPSEFDGHTSQDVADRLLNYIKG